MSIYKIFGVIYFVFVNTFCLLSLMKRDAAYRQQNLAGMENLKQNNNICKREPYSLARLETHS